LKKPFTRRAIQTRKPSRESLEGTIAIILNLSQGRRENREISKRESAHRAAMRNGEKRLRGRGRVRERGDEKSCFQKKGKGSRDARSTISAKGALEPFIQKRGGLGPRHRGGGEDAKSEKGENFGQRTKNSRG